MSLGPSIEVKVDLSEMKNVLQKLPSDIGRNALRAALGVSAKPLLAEVKSRTPVQQTGNASKRTGGALLESMRIKTRRSKDDNIQSVSVGSSLYYCRFVEFGTRTITPRGFMRAALDTAAQDVLDSFVEDGGARIERIFQKYQKRGGK